MRKMSGDDSFTLSIEGATTHLHTAALAMVDPTTASGFSFEKLHRTLEERIHRIPKLNWRLREVPFDLDRPYWDELRPCHIAQHLHQISLVAPGSQKELCNLVGELLSRQLDRRLPLWEIWYIEGLAKGKIALLMKMHHCLFDGVSGAGLGELLADLEPDPKVQPITLRKPRSDLQSLYSDLEICARSVYSLLGTPYNVARLAAGLTRQKVKDFQLKRHNKNHQVSNKVPRTPFNGTLSARRKIAVTQVALGQVKEIKNHYGVTVNDVVLALCSTALRNYLLKLGQLPNEPLIAGVPISTRQQGDHELNNQVGTLGVSLATHINNPIERLMAIHESTTQAKDSAAAAGAPNVQAIASALPPLAMKLAGWLMNSAKLTEFIPMPANTVISNVPGPPFPLYICGAKVTSLYPLGPIVMGMGFNITMISYIDQIYFGICFDPKLVSDVDYFVEGLQQGLSELLEETSAQAV